MSFHNSFVVTMIAESASLSQPVMLSRTCLLTSPTYAVCAYLKSLLIRCADIKGAKKGQVKWAVPLVVIPGLKEPKNIAGYLAPLLSEFQKLGADGMVQNLPLCHVIWRMLTALCSEKRLASMYSSIWHSTACPSLLNA